LRTLSILALCLLSSPAAELRAESSPAGGPDFHVIVNERNPISSLERKFLADMFFRKVTYWPDDGVIQPVDLKPDSPVRHRFSKEVLNRSVMGIKSYWQQRIFSGQNVPPPELRSDEEVIQFVVKYPGSVGYVSSSSVSGDSAPRGVKIVSIK